MIGENGDNTTMYNCLRIIDRWGIQYFDFGCVWVSSLATQKLWWSKCKFLGCWCLEKGQPVMFEQRTSISILKALI